MATTTTKPAEAQRSPILVELGKKKRKDVKRLRNGHGKLVDRVLDVIAELRRSGTLAADAEPVVMVVRKKTRKRRRMMMMGR